ncbi:MAG: CBS domain-containing protein [Myxococcota bacterium]|nr:CBS domain-containing protein [Myxococcota bacterium]
MSLGERLVSDVMQTEVASLSSGDRLDLVEDIMTLGRIRHMPVLEDGRLVGVVSNRDLLSASLSRTLDFDDQHRRSFIRSVEVNEVMSRDLCTVEPDTTLREAAILMLRRRVGCLPVTKPDGTLVGLVTETDLVRVAFLSDAAEEAPDLEEEEGVDALSRWVEAEFEGVRRARDELRVQAHLAKAEARDLWKELEHKFQEAESKVKLVLREAEGPAEDIAEAAGQLLRELRDGYRRLRDAGKSSD